METERLFLGWRMDSNSEGISENSGMTLSSLSCLGTLLYSLGQVSGQRKLLTVNVALRSLYEESSW